MVEVVGHPVADIMAFPLPFWTGMSKGLFAACFLRPAQSRVRHFPSPIPTRRVGSMPRHTVVLTRGALKDSECLCSITDFFLQCVSDLGRDLEDVE